MGKGHHAGAFLPSDTSILYDLTKVVYPLSCWLIAVHVTISIVVTYHHFNAVHLMSYDIVAVSYIHQWHVKPHSKLND